MVDAQIAEGASKTYSVADEVSIRAKIENDQWDRFDED